MDRRALAVVAAVAVAIRAAASTELRTIRVRIPAAAPAEYLTTGERIPAAASAETLAFLAAVVALTLQAVGFRAVLSSIEKICRWIRYSLHLLWLIVGNRPEAGRRNPDVFLNFSGQDIRNDWADNLYVQLGAKFSAFKDDCQVVGEHIRPRLFQAIENSEVAICIISKNCGGSDRFLTALSKIMRRHAEQRLLVLPIFYEVDVCHVRDQTGEFGQAFSELANHRPPEEVEELKKALRSVAKIGGWTSRHFANGRHAPPVNKVVEKVSSEFRRPWIKRILMFWNNRRGSNCQVFLISSPATTKTFASHLTYSLERKKISVFRDDDQYLIGKDSDREVCHAMDHCKIFIVVISEDFASCPDCLDKLAQMFKYVEKHGQKILPVFYEVDPSQGRELLHPFWMDRLQHNVPQESHERESFNWVCSIAEFVSENIGNGNGGKLVEAVVQQVNELMRT